MINKNHFFNTKRLLIIKKNLFFSFIIKIFSFFLIFATPKLILLNIGYDSYGLFIFIISLGAFFNLLDLGVGNSLRNHLTKINSKKILDKSTSYLSSAYIFSILSSLFFLLLLIIFWHELKWDFFIKNLNKNNENINYIINFFIFFTIFSITLRHLNYLLFSLHKSFLVDLIDFSAKMTFFLTILFVYLNRIDLNLFLLIKLHIFSFLLVYIISNLIFFYKQKGYTFKINFFSTSRLKKIIKDGFYFFILQSSSFVLLFSDKILVSKLFAANQLANYFFTSQIFIVIMIFFNYLNAPLWSFFTDAYIKKDAKWIYKLILTELKILLIFLVVGFLIFLLSEKILHFWIGNDFVYNKLLAFSWFCYVIVKCLDVIFTYFLNGINFLKIQVYLSLFILIANIPLSIFFSVKVGLGVSGILIGTIICLFISTLVKAIFAYQKIYELKK